MERLCGGLGIRTFVFADYQMPDLGRCRRMAGLVNAVDKEIGADDIELLYHPHDVELAWVGKKRIIDSLLEMAPPLMLQPDIGWIRYAGEDPAGFIARYQDRVRMIHFKDLVDVFVQMDRRSCFAATGTGIVDTAASLAALHLSGPVPALWSSTRTAPAAIFWQIFLVALPILQKSFPGGECSLHQAHSGRRQLQVFSRSCGCRLISVGSTR